MKSPLILTIFTLIIITAATAQQSPFQLSIEPMSIEGLGGVQSFAVGQHEGIWLIIGGRIDGLHRRQPWASFDEAGLHTQLLVIDPMAQQKWTAPLSVLPLNIREQLSATNMEFIQEGDYLYLIGGYGYSDSEGDHITYPYMTAVKVPDVISAVINGTEYASFFRQIQDELFAVTGGYLNKIYDTYYLTGGQRFDGRYNPMNGPSFVQEYTNAIRKFTINDDGINLSVTHFTPIIDAVNLHRRDFNVVEQIMSNGEEGLTAFSGVFQQNVNLPFLNPVDINSSGYYPNNTFSQYYNHYHCAHVPLYSAATNEMHTIFFGGIAQYYDDNGVLVQDQDIPFVKTIARVTRDVNGNMAEYKLPVEMPAYLGAGSEFIRLGNLPQYSNGVLNLDQLSDGTLLGYIYGGINSSAPNIFFTNEGTESTASSQLFKVYLLKDEITAVDQLNEQSNSTLQLQILPNPNTGSFYWKVFLKQATEVRISVYDQSGKLLFTENLGRQESGSLSRRREIEGASDNGIYIIKVETEYETVTQKVMVAN
jgi:Secretion system C-terminal sorting domain